MTGVDSGGSDLAPLDITAPVPFPPCPVDDDIITNRDPYLDQGEELTTWATFVTSPDASLDELHLADASRDVP